MPQAAAPVGTFTLAQGGVTNTWFTHTTPEGIAVHVRLSNLALEQVLICRLSKVYSVCNSDTYDEILSRNNVWLILFAG